MTEIKVPSVGESISEVTLVKWLKKEGDYVNRDEVLCELESEKATFELNAEQAGILHIVAYLISIIGVAVFTGLTAYDVQKLKRIGAGIEYEGTSANDTKKQALLGALSLYLDFINLFIMLLRLFGNRRN